jgi:hypothetical protein
VNDLALSCLLQTEGERVLGRQEQLVISSLREVFNCLQIGNIEENLQLEPNLTLSNYTEYQLISKLKAKYLRGLFDHGMIHYLSLMLMTDLKLEGAEVYRGMIHCRCLLTVGPVPEGRTNLCFICGEVIEDERVGIALPEDDTIIIRWKHQLCHIVK